MTIRATLRTAILEAVIWLAGDVAVKATSAEEDYDVIRADYSERLFDAFMSYIQTGSRAQRNAAGRAVAEDVIAAFERGYRDGGGEELEDDDKEWSTAKQGEQVDYLDGVFDWLKDLRANDTATEDAIQARVDMWVSTLDGIYAAGKLRGAGNKMLTWLLGDTEQHCDTCAKLDGQRHSAKWWDKHGYIPGEPGSQTLDCKGYNCDCRLEDASGEEFTA